MSDAVLQAIRQRLDAVAGGSWSMQYTEIEHEHSGTSYWVALGPFRKDKNDAVNDARFLSHVVGDVAVLLEEVEALTVRCAAQSPKDKGSYQRKEGEPE